MTTITRVRAWSVALPLANVTSLSNRVVRERHYGLVEVTGDDGITGIGFCYIGNAGAQIFVPAVEHLLARSVIGQDAHRVEGIWAEMYQDALLHGRAGTVMRGLSALDIALWDRNARAADLPLYKFLGAFAKDTVPAYASGGYYLQGKTPEMLADECQGYVENGFTSLKIKVGGSTDPNIEEARIKAVRERIGPDIELMLDANNAWKDVPTALRYIRRYEKYDPAFIEEPFSPDDIENHARLAKRTPLPVATGEIEVGRWRHRELLTQEAALILQTDACVCGGITEWRRIACAAATHGITIYPHWFHDVHVHLVASTPNARIVEYFPDDAVLNFYNLVDTQLEARGGQLVLPQRPGLGFNFVADLRDRHTVAAWDSAA
jgi:L-alanine-DL-glutamate epimerase-like enolase superfamily enzyme